MIAGNRRRGGSAPFTIAGLFAAGEKGAYYDFTDAATLAVNADGSGGAPAIGGACRWAADLSPNANHLRNTVTSATRRAAGIETDGAGYGLFNMPAYGGWPSIPEPFEIICVASQLAYAGTDRTIFTNNSATLALRQSAASGNVRFYDSGYGPDFSAPINSEFSIALALWPSGRSQSVNGGAAVALPSGGQPLDGLVLGSGSGGGASGVQARFKRLVVVGRALTSAERAGAVAWASE